MNGNGQAGPRILKVGEEPPPMRSAADDDRQAGRRSKNAKRKAKGRFAAVNAFMDFTVRDLDRAQIVVWLLLWRDTKPDGLACASQTDLARRAGVTPRTVERAVNRLIRAGLLTVVVRGGLRQGPNRYRIHPLTRGSLSDTGVGLLPDKCVHLLPTRVSDIP